jgi:hypothetical protein
MLAGEQLARVVLDSAAAAKKKVEATGDGFLPLSRLDACILSKLMCHHQMQSSSPLGAIKNHSPPPAAVAAVLPNGAASASQPNRYCHVVLPLSPNHGLFGFDGLYAESKIGLETLYYKWSSEGWSDRIGLVGAEIGWTKGTGLMSSNDLVAERMESQAGLRTFDSTEMAINLTALMTEPVVALARQAPFHSDLACTMPNSVKEPAAGREIDEQCRPCTSATACVRI